MCWEEILYTLTNMHINRANQPTQHWTQWLVPLRKLFKVRKLPWGLFLASIEAITSALLRHRVPPLFERWIASMLTSRCIITSLMGETMQAASVSGCPIGWVLSPLLWNLTVDELLWDLNEAGYYSIGFEYDIAIIIRPKSRSTVSEVLQNALKRLENWCNRIKPSFNSNKTTIVPFTRLIK
jgi:Reverse transcriptase (RNA-dependent DNA polymerase).